VVGTSHYMAPEQVTERSADARTDLYALGCVLYAMLAGHPPFTGQNALAVLYQHQHEPARPLRDLRPDVPAAVEQLVQDLLAKDPDDRPADAVAVAARLRGASSAEVPAPTRKVSAARITVTDTALDVASPRRGRLLAAAAALLAAGLAGYFFAGTGSSDRATATTVDGTASTSPSPTTSAPPITPKATPKAAPKSPPKTTPKAQPAVANNPTAYVIAVISRQHRDGNIASDATADLTARVQRLSGEDGHGNGEVHKVDDIRQRLAAYVSAGKVTTAGSAAIGAALDRLAPHVPKKGKGDD
ncbi:MAG TPA: protein kinase, partial [Micromonosporaceae bacterium]